MRSARRGNQPAALAAVLICALGAGGISGCSTTQEKAAAQRAESARILKAREKRRARKNHKNDADGTKTDLPNRKSSRQRGGSDE